MMKPGVETKFILISITFLTLLSLAPTIYLPLAAKDYRPPYAWPTINYVTDSLGNVQTNSWGKETGGDWPPDIEVPTLVVGDVITFTAYAQSGMQYIFRPKLRAASWNENNQFVWVVSEEDIGHRTVVLVGIKDADEYLRFGAEDDYTYMIYNVNPWGIQP